MNRLRKSNHPSLKKRKKKERETQLKCNFSIWSARSIFLLMHTRASALNAANELLKFQPRNSNIQMRTSINAKMLFILYPPSCAKCIGRTARTNGHFSTIRHRASPTLSEIKWRKRKISHFWTTISSLTRVATFSSPKRSAMSELCELFLRALVSYTIMPNNKKGERS